MVTFVKSTLLGRYLFLDIVPVVMQEVGLIYIVKALSNLIIIKDTDLNFVLHFVLHFTTL